MTEMVDAKCKSCRVNERTLIGTRHSKYCAVCREKLVLSRGVPVERLCPLCRTNTFVRSTNERMCRECRTAHDGYAVIYVSRDIHDRFKRICNEEGVSMTQTLDAILGSWLWLRETSDANGQV